MSAKLWTEEQFNCPVCLDLPHDPVTIPCGHSYCMDCIKDYWGKDDHVGIYSCPQCRQTFCPKPPLSRNTMLAEAVEQLRRAALTPRDSVSGSIRRPGGAPAAPAPSSSSSSSSSTSSSAVVPCDVCQGEPLPAVKTCLVCLASYCEPHLKPHRQAAALKRHELISPTGQLTQKICPQHKYLQEFYCRGCQAFVCWLCTSNEHKGHETTSTKAERTERQKEMGEVQAENQLKLQEREKELKEMKVVVESLKRSADRVHGESEQILTELQRSLERLQELVEEVMDSRGQDKLREAQEVVEKLEAEISELKRRDSEMRQLVSCEDNIHFLQNFKSLCSPFEGGELPSVTASPDASFEPVCTVLLELRNKIEDLCNQDLSRITKTVENMQNFTLGDKGKTVGSKFSFLKMFSGRGSKNADKRDQAPASASVGIRSADRLGPASSLRAPNVRSRDTPRERASPRPHRAREVERREREQVRDVTPTPQRRMESQRRAEPSAGHPVVDPGAGSVAGQHGGNLHLQTPQPTEVASGAGHNAWGANGVSAAATAAMLQQGIPNPSLFLDSPSDAMPTPAFPGLTEIPIQSLQAPAPRTRAEFLQYACRLTLDPATAHRRLCLTEGNTKATLQGASQPYPDLPTRFDSWTQVMCRDALSADRCYWEVEWRGRGSAVGVAYAAMVRKGADGRAGLGYNALSWSLELSDTCCAAMHHNEKHDIAVGYSPRVGVFVDRRAGTLAFYSVSDNMAPLYTFETAFVEPLFPAFGVGSGVGVGLDFALGHFSSLSDSIKICAL